MAGYEYPGGCGDVNARGAMTELLAAEGKLTPCCSKSHVTYTVHLPHEIDELHVDFAYEPKRLEDKDKAEPLIRRALERFLPEDQRPRYADRWESYLPLQNLLTLSFDDEERFRGAGHRHDPVQHLTIGRNAASPGLLPGPIPAGQLKITVSAHCIVTEECRYKLLVGYVSDGRERR